MTAPEAPPPDGRRHSPPALWVALAALGAGLAVAAVYFATRDHAPAPASPLGTATENQRLRSAGASDDFTRRPRLAHLTTGDATLRPLADAVEERLSTELARARVGGFVDGEVARDGGLVTVRATLRRPAAEGALPHAQVQVAEGGDPVPLADGIARDLVSQLGARPTLPVPKIFWGAGRVVDGGARD